MSEFMQSFLGLLVAFVIILFCMPLLDRFGDWFFNITERFWNRLLGRKK